MASKCRREAKEEIEWKRHVGGVPNDRLLRAMNCARAFWTDELGWTMFTSLSERCGASGKPRLQARAGGSSINFISMVEGEKPVKTQYAVI